MRFGILKQAVKELRESIYIPLSKDSCYAVPAPLAMPEMPQFAVQVWDGGTDWSDAPGGALRERIALGVVIYFKRSTDRTGHRAITEDLLDKCRGVMRTLYLSTLDSNLTVPLYPTTESSIDYIGSGSQEITHLRKMITFTGQIWVQTDDITW